MTRYCLNCEEPVLDLLADFCSIACMEEFAANADPEILAHESNTNPDALPISDAINSARTNRGHYNKDTGIIPPNSIEAISSLLQTSSQHDIANAVKYLDKEKERK